jgi:hypothetical protein
MKQVQQTRIVLKREGMEMDLSIAPIPWAVAFAIVVLCLWAIVMHVDPFSGSGGF